VKPKSNFVILIGDRVQYSLCDEEDKNLFYDTNVEMKDIQHWLDEEVKRINYDPREYLFEVKIDKRGSLPLTDALEELDTMSDIEARSWRELILQEIERITNKQVGTTYEQSDDSISIGKKAADGLEEATKNYLIEVFQVASSYSDKRGSDIITELDFHKAAEELNNSIAIEDK